MFYTGLMFGSRLPEGLWPYEDDDPKGGIIPRYEENLRKRGMGQHWIPDQAYENNLVGFWVALPPGCEGFGAAKLEGCCPWDQVPIRYEGSLKRARELWVEFDSWIRMKQDILLPPPVLWMAEIEL